MQKRKAITNAITNVLHLALAVVLILSLSTFVSCSNDDDEINGAGEATLSVKLTIQTRASSDDSQYSEWENYIDVDDNNFRIYFFTSDTNTLITTLYATDVTEGSNNNQYIVTGNVTDVMTAYTNFKVVVLANWGAYPTATIGVTTIDNLVEGENTTFNTSNFLPSGIDTNHYIPFYGVSEYTGVDWETGTTLVSTTIYMLSALAKVEVTFDETIGGSVGNVEIVRYNSKGYCAPKDVYSERDYVKDGTLSLSSIHLVGNANDENEDENEPKTYSFVEEDENTWVIYLPEYNNSSSDYSYILVTPADEGNDRESLKIYFGEYDSNGVCIADYENGGTNNRFDISRNCYYHFTVVSSDNTNTTQSRSATQEAGSQASPIQVTAERVVL